VRWPRIFRHADPPTDADRALKRAHAALSQSDEELRQTLHEARKIRRELDVNHFGQLIFEDMMRRRPR
jgi:hypothetical protein